MAISGRAEVDRAFAENRDPVMALPGVNAVWTDEKDGRASVFVGGQNLSPETKQQIRDRLKVPVEFVETGTFRAFGTT